MSEELEKINQLLLNNTELKGMFIVRDILAGKTNLGEYETFRAKMKPYYLSEKLWYYKVKKLYNTITDYIWKELILKPRTHDPHIYVDLQTKTLKMGEDDGKEKG